MLASIGMAGMALCSTFSIVSQKQSDTNFYDNIQIEQNFITNDSIKSFISLLGDVNYASLRYKIFENKMNYSAEMRRLDFLFEDVENYQPEIVEFFESNYEKDYFIDMFNWIIDKENDANKYLMLSSLLDTDIDIFTEWYVKSLKKCMNSSDFLLKKRSMSIYRLYEKKFEEVLC